MRWSSAPTILSIGFLRLCSTSCWDMSIILQSCSFSASAAAAKENGTHKRSEKGEEESNEDISHVSWWSITSVSLQ